MLCLLTFCSRYEEDRYWRKSEKEHMYWEDQQQRLVPPVFTNHAGVPVSSTLVRTKVTASVKT